MIIDAILIILYFFVSAILSPLLLFDDVTLPSGLDTALTQISNTLMSVDSIFDTTTFLVIVGLFVSIELVIASYKLIMFVVRKVPGLN